MCIYKTIKNKSTLLSVGMQWVRACCTSLGATLRHVSVLFQMKLFNSIKLIKKLTCYLNSTISYQSIPINGNTFSNFQEIFWLEKINGSIKNQFFDSISLE